jgi:hypothetical protein
VKRKQKKMLMFALCAAAVIAMVVQLGPFVFGKPSPYADSAKAEQKKAAASQTKPKPVRRKRPAPQARRPATPKPRHVEPDRKPQPVALTDAPINLRHVERRVLAYGGTGLRDPFAEPAVEAEQTRSPVQKLQFKLQGVIVTASRKVAIIDGRVYGEGQEIRAGVRVISISKLTVVLSDGESRTVLSLNRNDWMTEKP